jgi:hypothetical protein
VFDRSSGTAVINNCGTLVGAHGTLCPRRGPAKDNKLRACNPPNEYIVSCCWEPKWKLRLKHRRSFRLGFRRKVNGAARCHHVYAVE